MKRYLTNVVGSWPMLYKTYVHPILQYNTTANLKIEIELNQQSETIPTKLIGLTMTGFIKLPYTLQVRCMFAGWLIPNVSFKIINQGAGVHWARKKK